MGCWPGSSSGKLPPGVEDLGGSLPRQRRLQRGGWAGTRLPADFSRSRAVLEATRKCSSA